MRKMGVGMKLVFRLTFLLLLSFLASCSIDMMVDTGQDNLNSQGEPDRNTNSTIRGTFNKNNAEGRLSGEKGGTRRVSVYTVALFTIAMASATGLGAVPFFFMQLDPQLTGICNGMAAGVMLAASFDLVQEGQEHGNGSWVAAGIVGGGVFILLCKKFIEQYGEVSMLDIKGADAAKVVLVIGIMTLHSFGEGSGVGVSFAGSKGLSQGALVTLAIAVHNIPEGLAVSMVLSSKGISPQNAMMWSVFTSLPQPIVAIPSFIFAESFDKFLPFCTGFAAGCMIWMVVAEVLPDAFKEASPTQIASATILSVAFMESLSSLFKAISHSPPDAIKILSPILSVVGPLLGGAALVTFALAFRLQHSFLIGVASGIAFFLSGWCPLQLLLSADIAIFSLLFLLASGSLSVHLVSSAALRTFAPKRTSSAVLSSAQTSVPTLRSFIACAASASHAFAEGVALAAAGPEEAAARMPSLYGLPRGAAVAASVFSVTESRFSALAAAVVVGSVEPAAAAGASVAGVDPVWVPRVMVLASGGLFAGFYGSARRAVRLEMKPACFGLSAGFAFCCLWAVLSTKLVFSV